MTTLNEIVTLLGGGGVVIGAVAYVGKQVLEAGRWYASRDARHEEVENAREKQKLDLEKQKLDLEAQRIAIAAKEVQNDADITAQFLDRITTLEDRDDSCRKQIEAERIARQQERAADRADCEQRIEAVAKLARGAASRADIALRRSDPHIPMQRDPGKDK